MISKELLYKKKVIAVQEKIKLIKGGINNTHGKEKEKLKQELEHFIKNVKYY